MTMKTLNCYFKTHAEYFSALFVNIEVLFKGPLLSTSKLYMKVRNILSNVRVVNIPVVMNRIYLSTGEKFTWE